MAKSLTFEMALYPKIDKIIFGEISLAAISSVTHPCTLDYPCPSVNEAFLVFIFFSPRNSYVLFFVFVALASVAHSVKSIFILMRSNAPRIVPYTCAAYPCIVCLTLMLNSAVHSSSSGNLWLVQQQELEKKQNCTMARLRYTWAITRPLRGLADHGL